VAPGGPEWDAGIDAGEPATADGGADAGSEDGGSSDAGQHDGGGDGGVLFRSNWSSGTGNSLTAINDGAVWQKNVCTGTNPPNMLDVMRVTEGAPYGWQATPNLLRLTNRGASACALVEVLDRIPAQTSFYFRYYIWVQEGSGWAHHHNTLNCCGAIQAVHWSKMAWQAGSSHLGTAGYQPYFAMGAGEYPYDRWAPKSGQWWAWEHWYRLEGHVEFTGTRQTRWSYRVYHHGPTVQAGDHGTLIQTDASFYAGGGEPSRTESETMQAWFAAGNRHLFTDGDLARRFGLGTEGGGANTDSCPDGQTGCRHWAYAGVEVRTDRWPGPLE
jgi:hypothetical protein